MGAIGWLVAIGGILIGAAIAVWGYTELSKTITIWLIGFPGAVCLVIAAGIELQRIAEEIKSPAAAPPTLT
jgi:hypothetical protein